MIIEHSILEAAYDATSPAAADMTDNIDTQLQNAVARRAGGAYWLTLNHHAVGTLDQHIVKIASDEAVWSLKKHDAA